jgi:hypothetical protein
MDGVSLLSALSPWIGGLGIGALIAAVLTGWLTDRREHRKQRIDFVSKQLAEFYGPLLGMRQEIFARSELRMKIHNVAETLYQQRLEKYAGNIEALQRASDEYMPLLDAMIEDDNRALAETLMPLYRKMVEIFRDKMWLAEPQTRSYFPRLVEFVDVWDRVLRDALPRDVPGAVGHGEINLHEFYEHVQSTHDRLRRSISGGT